RRGQRPRTVSTAINNKISRGKIRLRPGLPELRVVQEQTSAEEPFWLVLHEGELLVDPGGLALLVRRIALVTAAAVLREHDRRFGRDTSLSEPCRHSLREPVLHESTLIERIGGVNDALAPEGLAKRAVVADRLPGRQHAASGHAVGDAERDREDDRQPVFVRH